MDTKGKNAWTVHWAWLILAFFIGAVLGFIAGAGAILCLELMTSNT